MAVDRLEPVPEDWQRAMAIVPHPDDVEMDTASAVAKWTTAGKQVTYLLVTNGEAGIDSMEPSRVAAIRQAEQREAALLVGVRTVEFLNYPDGIVEYGTSLRRDLARHIRRHRPEVILVTNFDLIWPGGALNQADHRAVGLAACDAARDAGNRWIFPELLDEGLEPWGGTRWVFANAAPGAGHACDVGDALIHGIASLKAHRVYFENLGTPFDPEEFLRKRALEIGQRLGCLYAVEFRVLRL